MKIIHNCITNYSFYNFDLRKELEESFNVRGFDFKKVEDCQNQESLNSLEERDVISLLHIYDFSNVDEIIEWIDIAIHNINMSISISEQGKITINEKFKEFGYTKLEKSGKLNNINPLREVKRIIESNSKEEVANQIVGLVLFVLNDSGYIANIPYHIYLYKNVFGSEQVLSRK